MGIFSRFLGTDSEPTVPEPIVEEGPNAEPTPGDPSSAEIGTFHMKAPAGPLLQFIVVAMAGYPGSSLPSAPDESRHSYIPELTPSRLVIKHGTLDETYFALTVDLEEEDGVVRGHVYLDRPYDDIARWSTVAAQMAYNVWMRLRTPDYPGVPDMYTSEIPRPNVHIDGWSTYMTDRHTNKTIISRANVAAWAEVGTFSTLHPMRTMMEIICAAVQAQVSSGEVVPTEPGVLASIYVSSLTDDLIVVTAGNTVETYFTFSVQLSEDDSGTRGHAYWDRPLTEIKTWPGNAIDIKGSVKSVLGQASATLDGMGWSPGMPVDS